MLFVHKRRCRLVTVPSTANLFHLLEHMDQIPSTTYLVYNLYLGHLPVTLYPRGFRAQGSWAMAWPSGPLARLQARAPQKDAIR